MIFFSKACEEFNNGNILINKLHFTKKLYLLFWRKIKFWLDFELTGVHNKSRFSELNEISFPMVMCS